MHTADAMPICGPVDGQTLAETATTVANVLRDVHIVVAVLVKQL